MIADKVPLLRFKPIAIVAAAPLLVGHMQGRKQCCTARADGRIGSGVRLPTTLSTRQKPLRKQTESLQRGERRMCAISRRPRPQV
jgi:hypothetical protein